MREPVEHILRPCLPWRRDDDPIITECGFNAVKVQFITRQTYAGYLRDYGKQRTAMIVCMTCAQTAERWVDWATDPRKALGREIEWECGYHRGERGRLLEDELLAIEELIAKHGAEFRELIKHHADRREWLEKKNREKPRVTPPNNAEKF